MIRRLVIKEESGLICNEPTNSDVWQNAIGIEEIRHALEVKEFKIYYQPQVDVVTQSIVGMEVMIRWEHPVWGMIGPQNFIPIAERTGLIIPMGKWVIQSACRQCQEWRDLKYKEIPISVNLSILQFDDQSLIEFVTNVLEETGVTSKNLKLEITESIALKEIESAINIMRHFKKLGIGFAIDDFGTAYSSLHYIKEMPVDTIKLDKSFIDGIGLDARDDAIIEMVISLAKNLGMAVIAEGVETKKQLDFLVGKGCRIIQDITIISRCLPKRSVNFLELY